MTLDQQCSLVVRYWRKFFCQAEKEMESKDVTRSTRKCVSIGEKEVLRHFLENRVQMEIGVEDYIRDEVLRIVF